MPVEIGLDRMLKKREKTLYRLCKDTGLSYQQGFAILKKQTTRIDFQTIETICDYLDCDTSELIWIEKKTGRLEDIMKSFPETNYSKRTSSPNQSKKAKPFLQWVGGKREMIPQYAKYFPKNYKNYYEPFLGGGAMFFELEPQNAFLNDNNPELIKTYEGVRDNPYKVISLLRELKSHHSSELYMKIRSFDRECNIFEELEPYEIAARMIYLNQTCFNGVYRVNQKGQFNVPIGSSLDRLICDEATIQKASAVLKKAKIESRDFFDSLSNTQRGDFVYLDPPYFPISDYSDFTRYTKEKFYKEDQERLRDKIDELSKKGVYVMLSNSNCEFIKDLYKNYKIIEVQSSRSLNCKKEKRGKVSELLVINY